MTFRRTLTTVLPVVLCLFSCIAIPAIAGPGYALAFNGTNQYVTVPDHDALTFTNAFTWEAWVQITKTNWSAAAGEDWAALFAKDSYAKEYWLAVYSNKTINVRFNANQFATNFSATAVSTSSWQHVAATWDGTNVCYYLNGALDHTVPWTNEISNTTNVLLIGRDAVSGGRYHFGGLMDELRLWNVARSQAEIQATMNRALSGSESGLVAYWPFDENGGTVISNRATATGSACNGVPSNTPTWVASTLLFVPDTATDGATAVLPTRATLNGNVNPNGQSATAWFEWGATTNYGNLTASTNLAATNSNLTVSSTLTNLTLGQTVHYRLVATNSAGSTAGTDRSVTLPSPAATWLATGVGTHQAQLNGLALPDGLATTIWFEWGTNTAYGHITAPIPLSETNISLTVSAALTNLTPSRTYHFRLVATNSMGSFQGCDLSLRTLPWSAMTLELTGADTVTNECHTAYVEPGATACASPSAIGAGWRTPYSLVLKADGTVFAVGNNDYGQCTVPASATNIVAIGAGEQASMALTRSGEVMTWGSATFSSQVPASARSNVIAIAMGGLHGLALKDDGSILFFGDTAYGQNNNFPVSANSNFVAISAGYAHNLALKADGTTIAWGYNWDGQCNIPPSALSNVVAISGGTFHSLALKADGSVVAWGITGGLGYQGQTVVPDAALSNVTAIAAVNALSLALKVDGSVVVWGRTNENQCTVPASATNVVAIAACESYGGTDYFSIALKADGSVIGWGVERWSYAFTFTPSVRHLKYPVGVSGTLDVDTPGSYLLTYSATNDEGAVASATRTVVVVDTTAPVVTLLGDNPIEMLADTPFVDPGATASDTCAGDLTGSIVVTGVVNTAVPGLYTLTYSATDASDNTGATNRAVWVKGAPSITGLSASLTATNPISGTREAMLRADVAPNGLATTAFFQYGLTTAYPGSSTPVELPAGSLTASNLTCMLDSLMQGVLYHWRVVASNSHGVTTSPDQLLSIPALYAPGDFNGNGVVEPDELAAVYAGYWQDHPTLITNTLGLGSPSVQLEVADSLGWDLTAMVSTDMVNWTNLPVRAQPVFHLVDPGATNDINRYYRLQYP
jgi:hypothetical protein